MLVGSLGPQRREDVLLPRVDERLSLHRHPAVGDDHREVHSDTDHQQPHASHAQIGRREREEQRVGDHQHHGAHGEVDPRGSLGQGDELDAEANKSESPPVQS